MVVCGVATCKALFRKGSPPSFFSFPRDPAVRARWVAACKRADNFDPGRAKICSGHFREEDYDESYMLQRKLFPNVVLLPCLKKDAIPSLKIPSAHW